MPHVPAQPVTSPTYGHAVRDAIDRLHAEALRLTRRATGLARFLDRGACSAADRRVRTAAARIRRGSEAVHAAFHTAPPRCAGPGASVARLCGRRMRHLAVRLAKRGR
ncbi:hypothetical protein ACFOOM_32615 [Streptomyces echinoruber]|uniref:Uncharacterized protein n=1 Tax=Streptomyces echinoruber TaxID=68898 RepID=A0A918S1Q7_9ACTN|nr:hypothetical protein [Streptomyces echinoruber]GHA19076.1 hypothetical protein GCM10010389_66130 [Streptomyces echinoruber]